MVIDTSALVAVLLREPSEPALARVMDAAVLLLLGAPTRTEALIVAHGRRGAAGTFEMQALLHEINVTDVASDRRLADLAADAYAAYGKGNHPARLNLGDCFTYALAKQTGEPILCVGDDFTRTDIAVVPLDL